MCMSYILGFEPKLHMSHSPWALELELENVQPRALELELVNLRPAWDDKRTILHDHFPARILCL